MHVAFVYEQINQKRNGKINENIRHIESESFTADLTMPKALGGAGEAGKTNPEELFAGGYAACFQSALNGVAVQMGITMPSAPEDSVIESTVELVGSLKELDLGLRVHLLVKVKGVPMEDLEKAVARAKEVCPDSRAREGNVYTTIKCECL